MYFDKLTKNLVIIVSSLWTRYSIKIFYVNVRTDIALPSPVRIRSHFDGLTPPPPPPPPPNCGRNK